MRTVVFSTKPYDESFLRAANLEDAHELVFLETRLTPKTRSLAYGAECVCAFVNDELDAATLADLQQHGLRLIALRCAGFNNVDLAAAVKLGVSVVRVPAYSPYAVAEHTVALMLMLNRRLHQAYVRNRAGAFVLDGLTGFDMRGKTVGVVGTGKIGRATAEILLGFGCRILAFDNSRTRSSPGGRAYATSSPRRSPANRTSSRCTCRCSPRPTI